MATLEELEPAAPIEVEVTRGGAVESRHWVSAVVVDTEGRVVLRAGETVEPVYGRSAIKPLQALGFVESGAAAAIGASDAEVALACASHSGEARHVAGVAAWLERIGCSGADLECGPHLPYHPEAAARMLRAGETPGAIHNNCSGKHSGFLSLARHQGWETAGYVDFAHPVQQRVLGILESMTGLDLSHAPRGIDGCGIPTIAIPLGNMALAMARLAVPDDQPERRQAACARIRAAMAAEPFMVGGSDSFCSKVMAAAKGKALVKTGAEGVYCGAFPELGLGVALKCRDGATRGAEAAIGHLLGRLGVLDEAETAALSGLLEPDIANRAGRLVGKIRIANGSAA
jgi:L-asparaginase II